MITRKDDIELEKHFPFAILDNHMPPFADMGRVHHWHDCLEISYVKKGRGRYYIEDKIYEMSEGDIIIINNIEPHYLEVDDEDMHQPVIVFEPSMVWSRDSESLDYDYLKPFFERGSDFKNRLDGKNPYVIEIKGHLDEIEREYKEQPEGYHLMIKARLLMILTFLIRYFRNDCKGSLDNISKRANLVKIEEAIRYIYDNFNTDLTLDEVSGKLYLSPQYFSMLFKKATGINFIDYVSRVRVHNAIEMLRETDRKITHIAMECGFNNTATFNSTFKRFTGKTPSEYR